MKRTIGFNNKKNIWTSKYDYESSNYASFDKRFFSCRKRVLPADDVVAWEHGTNASNNTFYGTQYPSSIAVSFNDNPSQNKLYKTFSVEGTDNLQGAVHTFTTSETLQPNKNPLSISVGTVSNKGGILYGTVPKDPRVKANVNMKFIGSTSDSTSISPAGPDLWFFEGIYGNTDHIGPNTKFAFIFSNPQQQLTTQAPIVFSLSGEPIEVTSDTDYFQDLNSGITSVGPQDITNNEVSALRTKGLLVKATAPAIAQFLQLLSASNNATVSIFAITDPRLNGDFLRGQHAEVAINLGSDNFELYSLNLNYEPTDLDHSK